MRSELKPIYDGAKSFYRKAMVDYDLRSSQITLYSYDTKVADVFHDSGDASVAIVYGTHSATTLRHIKEFLRQNGFRADSKKQIEADYMERC